MSTLMIVRKRSIVTNTHWPWHGRWANQVGAEEISLGDLFMELGEYEKAITFYKKNRYLLGEAKYYLKKKKFKNVIDLGLFLETAEKNGNWEAREALLIALGEAEEGLGNMERAGRHYKQARDFLENLRVDLTTGDRYNFFIHYFWDSPIGAYEGLVRRFPKTRGKWEEAFYEAEFTRGRILRESMVRRLVFLPRA